MRYSWIYDSSSDLVTLWMLGKQISNSSIGKRPKIISELKSFVMKSGTSARKAVQLTIRSQVDIYDLFVTPIFNDSDTVAGIGYVWFDTTDQWSINKVTKEWV